MKYTHKEKAKRNQALVAFCNEYPNLSLKEIGEKWGLSKPRVWKILQRAEANATKEEGKLSQFTNTELEAIAQIICEEGGK